MLKWNKVINYNKNLSYEYQRENNIVKLPRLKETVLIYLGDECRKENKPFVGYFNNAYSNRIDIIYSKNGSVMLLEYASEMNLQWARFNMPERNNDD